MSKHLNRPDKVTIWKWLHDVPDPEVPVVSVVDLGIVRDVNWVDDCLEVTVTPTYSGCPATGVIAMDIETALRDHGIETLKITNKLSPAWTSDWMSDEGREKLRAYGIAPPEGKASACGAGGATIKNNAFAPNKPVALACPRCRSTDTKCVSWFGSTACKASYQCNDCLEPFDYFKCI